MKRRILAAQVLLIMILSCIYFTPAVQAQQNDELFDSAERFTDIESGKWYKEAVDYVVSHELFSGMSDTKFEPNTSMTRAMFVSVLARVDGAVTSKKTKTKFSDVPSGKWYTGAVKWASDNGIVVGMSDTTFEPNTSITREQMCKMLYMMLENQFGALAFTIIYLLIGFLINKGGIKGGIEKMSKVLMPALFLLLVAVVIFVAASVEAYFKLSKQCKAVE